MASIVAASHVNMQLRHATSDCGIVCVASQESYFRLWDSLCCKSGEPLEIVSCCGIHVMFVVADCERYCAAVSVGVV